MRAFLSVFGAGLLACSSTPVMNNPDAGDAAPEFPPPKCGAASFWTPGKKAFVDATKKHGLEGIIPNGIPSLAAVDIDGDGWADIVARGQPEVFILRNKGDGTFEDYTAKSGFFTRRDGEAGARPISTFSFGDLDNDGDLDAFTGFRNDNGNPDKETTSEILLNDGKGVFTFGPDTSKVRVKFPMWDSVAGGVLVDYDRDGVLDLWIVQNEMQNRYPAQDRLMRGDGAGDFENVTSAAGLQTRNWVYSAMSTFLDEGKGHSWGWSGAACDLNNDGSPELLAASYGRSPNHLWLADGAGGYTNRSVASGYAFDKNEDWSLDESARCYCATNMCAMTVPPPSSSAYCTGFGGQYGRGWSPGITDRPRNLGGNSGTTTCADLDNDGFLDLVTSEIHHADVGSSDYAEVLLNTREGEVRFERPGNDKLGLAREHTGMYWDEGIIRNVVFDFDNDGWNDIYFNDSDYPGTRALVYHQKSKLKFELVPTDQGIDMRRNIAAAVADFDHDGDLDVVVAHSRMRCDAQLGADCEPTNQLKFFENQMQGNFIQIALAGGAGTNRAAIGARVTVKTADLEQIREVSGGYGQYGQQDDLVQTIGLGAACTAKVTVRWPNADLTTETFDLPAGYRFFIEQGKRPKIVF